MGYQGGEETRRQLLADLISEHGRLFFRLAYRILRCSALAEDVCQQAFLKAWEDRGEIGASASLCAWVMRVVINESLQVVRRRKIERRGIEQRGLIVGAGQASPWGQEDARQTIVVAMERLPERARVVVTLRLMEGMSGNQVKTLLGCSAAEVSRQLHSGMDMLRDLLAEWRRPEGDDTGGGSMSTDPDRPIVESW